MRYISIYSTVASLHYIIYFLTVADMCTSSSATEETSYGSFNVDSVVLRIMTQQNNCICRVAIDNQIQSISIGLNTYDGHPSSAPTKADCGLAVDISHISRMSTGNVVYPIQCVDNVDYRTFPLLVNSYLQFKSRIINGSFTRGYCIRIIRGIIPLQFVNYKY